jgi:hypothetical protein
LICKPLFEARKRIHSSGNNNKKPLSCWKR